MLAKRSCVHVCMYVYVGTCGCIFVGDILAYVREALQFEERVNENVIKSLENGISIILLYFSKLNSYILTV